MATVSLQQLVLAISHSLRDCIESAATDTATSPTTLRDTTLKLWSTSANRFAGSEVLFLNGIAPASGINPLTVSGFTNTTGDLTLTATFGSNIPAGTAYALLNVGGQGHPYKDILAALDLAFSALALKVPATDQTLTLAAGADGSVSHDLTIPAGIDWLARVSIVRTAPYTQQIAPTLWRVLPGTRTLRVRDSVCLLAGDVVTFAGYSDLTRPAALADTVNVNLEQVVNTALEYLLRASKDRDEQTLMANLYGDRLRTGNTYRLPSTVRVG